jgi:hypothetical protein
MIELLIALAITVLTQLSKLLKLDGKRVVLGLSFILGTGYYIINSINPEILEFSRTTILAIYGISQVIYTYIIKYIPAFKINQENPYPTPTVEVTNPTSPTPNPVVAKDKPTTRKFTPKVLRPKVDWSKQEEKKPEMDNVYSLTNE